MASKKPASSLYNDKAKLPIELRSVQMSSIFLVDDEDDEEILR
jgi:hypothetical protein